MSKDDRSGDEVTTQRLRLENYIHYVNSGTLPKGEPTMKSIGRRLLSSVCILALVANSVAGVMAQDRKSDGKTVAV